MSGEEMDRLMDEEMTWAKKTKRLAGYSEEDNFPVRVALIRKGKPVYLPAAWQSEGEKREAMARTGCFAQALGADAVMLTSDMRVLRSEDFAQHFKLEPIRAGAAEEQIAEYKRHYHRIMEGFDNYMGNLPRHLYTETLGVVAKGPSFGAKVRFQPYRRGSGKSVLFLEEKRRDDLKTIELSVIGDWWTIPEDDPRIVFLRESAMELMQQMKGTEL